jgi:cyanophycinase
LAKELTFDFFNIHCMYKSVSFLLFVILCLTSPFAVAQSFTSYFTGDTSDVNTNHKQGVCLMGGASEDDNAMKKFLEYAAGGDVVVLRATGSDGYNNYLYTTLGIPVNSVQTLVIPSISAANSNYVYNQIKNAEAIFIAGGDQYNYVSKWKNTLVNEALDYAVNTKKIVIGGISAGMAIMGDAYFSAANGSIMSATALNNPFHSDITLGYGDFIQNSFLPKMITDTHFDNPDRSGRLFTFLARVNAMGNPFYLGIACDEYTAVFIDENKLAKVYGNAPAYADYAYFIWANCLGVNQPETMTAGTPLTWNQNGTAVVVAKIAGTTAGTNYYDLSIPYFNTQIGGTAIWQYWYAVNGTLSMVNTSKPNCSLGEGGSIPEKDNIIIFPNPAGETLQIINHLNKAQMAKISDMTGKTIFNIKIVPLSQQLDISSLVPGTYFLNTEGFSYKFHKY